MLQLLLPAYELFIVCVKIDCSNISRFALAPTPEKARQMKNSSLISTEEILIA
jgi:hypothetical protein